MPDDGAGSVADHDTLNLVVFENLVERSGATTVAANGLIFSLALNLHIYVVPLAVMLTL
jgi:hypothetical protein